ncbi:hypothetical protein [Nesterenkonia populi]|uniref:hypothetical protein n=1 Tax=Nesterenkonia populi TaxID=1591087 RepID=UPI0011BE5D32|nr:hypothetical protein [Nesterenkonia populi]
MSEDPRSTAEIARPATRRQRRAASEQGVQLNAIPFLIAGALVVLVTLGLLWWFVIREPGEDEDAGAWEWIEEPADGVHARDVPPEDWETGWCLVGYATEDEPADVVDCEQSYDVQVVLRQNISDGSYPGDTEVADTAHEWCHDDLSLNEDAVAEADYDLAVQLNHPTESTWNREDDRLVSCFLTRSDDGSLTGDYMLDEDADDEDEDAVEDPAEDGTADGVDVSAEPRDQE